MGPTGSIGDLADMASAVAATNQYSREAMGMNPLDDVLGDLDVSSSFMHSELLTAKFQNQCQDPAIVPGAVPRQPNMAERLGAKFAPQVQVAPPMLAEAAPTQANGRIIPSVSRRSMDSFSGGMMS